MDELVQIDAQHLQEVLNRLTDRRVAVDKEALILGEPKKGMNDIFRHCRGFERAYSLMLQEANTSFKIRGVVEGLLPDTLRRIPIEKRFNRAYVREICREADGYQPHLVSPERGIRRLVAEAMLLTNDHVHRFVDEVHGVLQDTVREAARRSVLAEAGLGATPGMEFLRLKGFENAVVVAADRALEEWKAEAHKVASTMVAMECDYVTPSFFRELEREWQEAQHGGAGGDGEEGAGGGAGPGAPAIRDAGDDDDDDSEDGVADGEAGRGSATPGSAPPPVSTAPDLKGGWLDKRSGDSSSLNALPVDSWKWQRRWFVLAGAAGVLAYFRNPEEAAGRTAQPRVTIPLKACVVDDFAAAPRAGGADALLIRIAHRDPAQPVAKAHHSVVLRAADAADKTEWLARLRAAAGQAAPARPTPAAAAAARAGTAAPGREGAASPERGLFGRSAARVGTAFNRVTGLGGSRIAAVLEVGSVEDLDAYYDRLGAFTGTYARAIYDRMSKTVPKAIILCQVIRSRDRLLDQLYTYLTALKPIEIEALLQEDSTVVKRRSAAQTAAKELELAQDEVRRAQERRATGTSPRVEKAAVSARALLLAGAFPLVPANLVPRGTNPAKLYGEHTPMALSPGPNEGPNSIRLGPPVKVQADGSAANGRGEEAQEAPRASPAPAMEPEAEPAPSSKPPRRQPPPPPPKLAS
ncbi:hypothetical protein ACKKBG_A14925 [Auxenochlorella protothecoides x Auxenochlorella symbiontica]|uniref:Uncharacterized protein n=1 Tax=Auxenochlorella protothecoides TaxID=3075 RepID=A0A1D2AAK6_AUXPR